MKERHLLDVNVWIALLDDAHVHSSKAHALIQKRGLKIATCPIIENSVLRLTNTPGINRLGPPGFAIVRSKMTALCTDLDHEFWPDDISLRHDAVIDWGRISGHNQITDAYLLALAVKHKGVLASFDQRIAISSVHKASAHHLKLL